MGIRGIDYDHYRKIEEIAHNTKVIAGQLDRLNGILELIYKNGILTKEK